MNSLRNTIGAMAIACVCGRALAAQSSDATTTTRETFSAHVGGSSLLWLPSIVAGASVPVAGHVVEVQGEYLLVSDPRNKIGLPARLHTRLRLPLAESERWRRHLTVGVASFLEFRSAQETRQVRLDGSELLTPAHSGWRYMGTWFEIGIAGIRNRQSGARLRWDIELGIAPGMAFVPRGTITTMWGGPS